MKTKKKKCLHQKWNTFFPEFKNSSEHLRSDAHQSQIIRGGGGCTCRPYSNYWGDTFKLLGEYIPPFPSGFGTSGWLSGHRQWRRRWRSAGHWHPPLGFKVSKFRAISYYLGKIASKFWAILHQNFGQFHIFWASLGQNFGQFNIHQTVSISVETFFLFFLEVTLIGTEKSIAFRAKLIQCHFSGKSLVPPQILFSSFAHGHRLQHSLCTRRKIV